jgi:histidyl-tRNA synthetase
MGNERLIALLAEAGPAAAARVPDAYVLSHGEGTLEAAFRLAQELRAGGLQVILHAGGGSLKSQMRKADASGARFALIVGEDELRAGEVSVKALRGDAAQIRTPAARVAAILKGD